MNDTTTTTTTPTTREQCGKFDRNLFACSRSRGHDGPHVALQEGYFDGFNSAWTDEPDPIADWAPYSALGNSYQSTSNSLVVRIDAAANGIKTLRVTVDGTNDVFMASDLADPNTYVRDHNAPQVWVGGEPIEKLNAVLGHAAREKWNVQATFSDHTPVRTGLASGPDFEGDYYLTTEDDPDYRAWMVLRKEANVTMIVTWPQPATPRWIEPGVEPGSWVKLDRRVAFWDGETLTWPDGDRMSPSEANAITPAGQTWTRLDSPVTEEDDQ